jgi:uncharacterized protein with HEPN domain
MQRDPRAFLWDVRESALAIQGFIAGMDADAYAASDLVQAGVERKFEIIGEALNQLAKLDAPLGARIPELPQIVAFRNQLIHGYATVKARTVLNVAQSSLPALLVCVNALLEELGEG